MNYKITEDYVSFEIAKLLKEKGFNGECRMIYREHDMQMVYHTPNPNDLFYFTINRKKLEKHSKKQHCDYALCPTYQMALKWLREVHNVLIYVNEYGYPDKEKGRKYTFAAKIRNIKLHTDITKFLNDSYEQAVEAALLYVLKSITNLNNYKNNDLQR